MEPVTGHVNAAASPPLLSTTWRIDPGASRAEFAVGNRLMLVANLTVKGAFSDIAGSITFDEQNPTRSRGDITIASASVDTGNPRRDKHLRSDDFFNVERYPHLTFAIESVEPIAGASNRFRVRGNLTVRDVTRPVTLDAQYTPPRTDTREPRVIVIGETTVRRQEFGLNWQNLMSRPADDVRLTITIEITPS